MQPATILSEINHPDYSLTQPIVSGTGGERGGRRREGPERILVQTFCTRICIHCTPAAIDIITRGAHAARRGAVTANGEVTELQALTRSDTGSRSAKHPPDFNGSRVFPVSALDQRSLPANQNT